MAKRGDLVLVFADAVSRGWKQIIYFKSDTDEHGKPRRQSSAPPSATTGPALQLPLPPRSAADLFAGEAIIHDERGVRLARETED